VKLTWNQNGPAGANGTNGTNGNTVLNGTGAPPSTVGANGDFYLDTSASTLYGPKANAVWPAVGVSLVGPQGPAGKDGAKGTNGVDGKTVLNGTGAPPAALGTDADFYLDTAVPALYGPKAGGSWPSTSVSLVGPRGPAGAGVGSVDDLNGSTCKVGTPDAGKLSVDYALQTNGTFAVNLVCTPDTAYYQLSVNISNTTTTSISCASGIICNPTNKTASGSISFSPTPAAGCSTTTTSCTALFRSGTTVALTAQPAAGSTESWGSGCDSVSGATCTVTLDRAKLVSVTFGF
jgi:hypothetical protein